MSMKAELGGMSSGAREGSERGLLGTWRNQKAQEERAGEKSCRGAWLEDQPRLRSGQDMGTGLSLPPVHPQLGSFSWYLPHGQHRTDDSLTTARMPEVHWASPVLWV